jgi:hypothetical protein
MLNKVDENIWNIEGDKVTMLTIPFHTRMTIIRLPDSKLWLHSPVALNTKRINAIRKLGEVSYIIAPNIFHHLFIEDWLKEFPSARLWGAEGLPKKRTELNFSGVLKNTPEQEWSKEIDQLYFQGSKILPEVVFFHKQSKTVIMTDLIQNHDRSQEKIFWKIVKKLNGVLSPNGGVPIDLRMTIRDKKIARKSLSKLLNWEFEKLIIGHGLCIESNAKEYVSNKFKWLKA